MIWFRKYYEFGNHSKDARKRLSKFTMYSEKIEDVAEYYHAMLAINDEIEPYGEMQQVFFQEYFVEGVRLNYRKDLHVKFHEKLYEEKKLGRSVVEEAWLLETAKVLEKLTPKKEYHGDSPAMGRKICVPDKK
jgi:hypothetical protein